MKTKKKTYIEPIVKTVEFRDNVILASTVLTNADNIGDDQTWKFD